MDLDNETNLDGEFKRYLKILRPYLLQLQDQDVIDICNAWIQKLSDCKEHENALRNKYVFTLCYQLANGVLEEPFLQLPPINELQPLHDDGSSDNSSKEVEYIVINSDSMHTKILGKQNPSQIFSDKSAININRNTNGSDITCNIPTSQKKKIYRNQNETSIESNDGLYLEEKFNESYKFRANNLLIKLRELKHQNMLMRNELAILKNERENKHFLDDSLDNILKVDNATNTYNSYSDSKTTLTSLKCKLQEVQNSRNALIDTVSSLQEKIDHFEELKKHELDEMEANHKLEIIKLKTSIREEVKLSYENKLDELKEYYKNHVLEIQSRTKEDIEKFYSSKEQIISEKDKILQNKEAEICRLKCQIEELKSHQFSVNRFGDRLFENSSDNLKSKTHELQKRLYKMERNKNKCAKLYEDKIASMHRERNLAECSLQLELAKQRTQFVNEATYENQTELATALDKLENKYKEIVANVQATAVQRRLQDQIALESLIQAVCGVSTANPYMNSTNKNTGQFPEKCIRNQSKDRSPCRDREIDTLRNSNKVENAQAANRSFGEDSIVTGYCLDSEKLQELFERVHIPQRDVSELPK